MKENKFKVGDRVKVTLNVGFNNRLDMPATVIGLTDDNRISVQHDDFIEGHCCTLLGKYGHCWHYLDNEK
jgi:ferredoxin-like protein FixX